MHTFKKVLLILFGLFLVAELGFLGTLFLFGGDDGGIIDLPFPAPSEAPEQTGTPSTGDSDATNPTQAATEAPTEAPTEPSETRYTISFTGDCTLGSDKDKWNAGYSFVQTIGENYDYPFELVRPIFEADDFTLINLEVVLSDEGSSRGKLFTFRGPAAYSQILTGSSVEGVTLANNHSRDFGQTGYDSTKKVLEDAGVKYAENYSSTMFVLGDKLVVGLYAVDGSTAGIDIDRAVEGIRQLKEDGAELIIVAAHWGNEGQYRPNSLQKKAGAAFIEAGAHIVWGHHPHVLQPIEEVDGGIIYNSLGNFSFGGNSNPRDKDSAIIQQEIVRDKAGNVTLGEVTVIPVSISSVEDKNNYQPMPLEEGCEQYERIISKLDGTFDGKNLKVDYSGLKS